MTMEPLKFYLDRKKPKTHTGNFIPRIKSSTNKDGELLEHSASYISGRQLFYDWSREEPIRLSICALDPKKI